MTGPIYLYFGLDRQKISLTYFIYHYSYFPIIRYR